MSLRGGPFDIWGGGGGGVEENNKLFPSLLEINKLFLNCQEKMEFHPKNNLFAGLIP